MKLLVSLATAGSIFGLIASGAIAQTAAPAAKTAPAPAPKMAPAPAAAKDKAAISKACSAQADAQNLHGKARKTFRSKCKEHGGTVG